VPADVGRAAVELDRNAGLAPAWEEGSAELSMPLTASVIRCWSWKRSLSLPMNDE